MKREILFRAKSEEDGKWCYGGITNAVHTVEGKIMIVSCANTEDGAYNRFCKIDENTVCQFTGLTDKNGTKSFDKDLIKAPSGRIYTIIWATWVHYEWRDKLTTDRYEFTGWCISKDGVNPCDLLDSEVMSGEIIGNLIDSPELLK